MRFFSHLLISLSYSIPSTKSPMLSTINKVRTWDFLLFILLSRSDTHTGAGHCFYRDGFSAAYCKSGYSKKYWEAHREEITLHKAAKAAFDEAGLQKLPRVKKLDTELAELLTKKKAAYPDYRRARNELQKLVRAQKNVERFLRRKRTPPRGLLPFG